MTIYSYYHGVFTAVLVSGLIGACSLASEGNQMTGAENQYGQGAQYRNRVYAQAYYGIEGLQGHGSFCRPQTEGSPSQNFISWFKARFEAVTYMKGGDQVVSETKVRPQDSKISVRYVGNFSAALERIWFNYSCELTFEQFNHLRKVPPQSSCLAAANIPKCYNGSLDDLGLFTLPSGLKSRGQIEKEKLHAEAAAHDAAHKDAEEKRLLSQENKIKTGCARLGGRLGSRGIYATTCRVMTTRPQGCQYNGFIDYTPTTRGDLTPLFSDDNGEPAVECSRQEQKPM